MKNLFDLQLFAEEEAIFHEDVILQTETMKNLPNHRQRRTRRGYHTGSGYKAGTLQAEIKYNHEEMEIRRMKLYHSFKKA